MAVAQLQQVLALTTFKSKHRWIPSHCDFAIQDEVDELAKRVRKNIKRWKISHETMTWQTNPDGYAPLGFNLESKVAKRLISHYFSTLESDCWARQDINLANLFDKQSIPTHVVRHDNFIIMSTLNRLRTNRTKLQTKVFIPFYCNSDSCSEIQGQCDACSEANRGRSRYAWGNCNCGSQNSVHHILYDCPYTTNYREDIIRFIHDIPLVSPIGQTPLPENILGNLDLTESKQATLNNMLYNLIQEYTRRIDGG